jgi:hypothetical protein
MRAESGAAIEADHVAEVSNMVEGAPADAGVAAEAGDHVADSSNMIDEKMRILKIRNAQTQKTTM